MPPPTNSPNGEEISATPTRTPSPASLLSSLGTPVLNIASTLTFPGRDTVDDNVDFLRSHTDAAETANQPVLDSRPGMDRQQQDQIMEQVQQLHLQQYQQMRRLQQQMQPLIEQQRRDGEHSLSADTRRRINLTAHLTAHHLANTSNIQAARLATNAAGNAIGRSTGSPYGSRVPNNQSLYDWAPIGDVGDEEDFEDILHELRQQRSGSDPSSGNDASASDSIRPNVDSRYRYHQTRYLPNGQTGTHEPSLRSAAILQSVRRNLRFSARSRDLMQRYVMDRDRAQNDENNDEARQSPSRWLRDRGGGAESSRYELNRAQWQAAQRPSGHALTSYRELEDYRRRYLADPKLWTSPFETAIQNLHIFCTAEPNEDITEAVSSEHLTDDDMSVFMKSFIFCDSRLRGPSTTSWLMPGVSFQGLQHAHHPTPQPSSGTTLHRLSTNRTALRQSADRSSNAPASAANGQQLSSIASPPGPNDSSVPANQTPPLLYDRWSVNVSIHSVDWENMTLAGTMEAYNLHVPNHNGPNSPSPASGQSTQSNGAIVGSTHTTPMFCTFLEGEIIDFSKHTLLTESFEALPRLDAAYWRRLSPFNSLTDDELAKALINRQWIEDELVDKYILMRWKERCFVSPVPRPGERQGPLNSNTASVPGFAVQSPAQPNALSRRQHQLASPTSQYQQHLSSSSALLSITGFYYLSLRRKDGLCEGLYCDPKLNSPYQHLELRPEMPGRMGLGSWEFR